MRRGWSQRQVFDAVVWTTTVVLAWISWMWVSGTPWFQVRYGDGEQRARALTELAQTDLDEALPRLKAGLTDEDPMVRLASADALLAVAESDPGTALPLLVGALESSDPQLVERALVGLERAPLPNDNLNRLVSNAHVAAADPLRTRLALVLLSNESSEPAVVADALAWVVDGGEGPVARVRAHLSRAAIRPQLQAIAMGDGQAATVALSIMEEGMDGDTARRGLRVAALKSEAARVRRDAIRGLAGDRPDLELMLSLLDARVDPDPEVRTTARQALTRLVLKGGATQSLSSDEQRELLFRALDAEPLPEKAWIVKLTKRARPEPELLAHRATAMNPMDRRLLAIELIGGAGGTPKSVVKVLATAYADTDPRLRDAAIGAMQRLGGRTIGPLVRDLEHAARPERIAAARALRGVKKAPDMAVRQLVRAAWDKSRTLRREVIATLAVHAKLVAPESREDVIGALIGRFDDSDHRLRDAAAEAVGSLGVMAKPLLTERARKGPERIRTTSRILLNRLD